MSDCGTDDHLWAAYKRGWDSLNGKPGANDDTRHLAGLYAVAAASWDEGWDAGEQDILRHNMEGWETECKHDDNPYQEATDV